MDEGKKEDYITTIFQKEYEVLSYFRKILTDDDINHDLLKQEMNNLVACYESLLKNAVKITRIGDVSQNRLLKAKEKIESLNEQLVESEKNIRELNTILMFYIKETDR
jgi:eukaryotic-like serine/threonine-protein kinase